MSHLYYANKEIQFLFESNDLSEIDYLLKNGLDINSCDVFNNNALFTADFEKTKFLVDRGINIFQKSYYYLADTSHLAVHTRQYELWYPYESVFNPIKHTRRELIFYNAMYNQSVIRTSGE